MFTAVVILLANAQDVVIRAFDTFDDAAAYLLQMADILGTEKYGFEIHPS